MTKSNLCPCGSEKQLSECCGAFIAGDAYPATPEQLMRSRYTASFLHDMDYLVATHHPSMRKPGEREELEGADNVIQWLNLRILDSPPALGDQGVVEFAAYYRYGGQDRVTQLHERSHFVHEDGRWYYVEGQQLPAIPMGRNDPCWCGSGRKLKQCHKR